MLAVLGAGSEVEEPPDLLGVADQIPVTPERALEHAVAAFDRGVKNNIEVPFSKEAVKGGRVGHVERPVGRRKDFVLGSKSLQQISPDETATSGQKEFQPALSLSSSSKRCMFLQTSSRGRNGNMSSSGLDSMVPSSRRAEVTLGFRPCVGERISSHTPGPSS